MNRFRVSTMLARKLEELGVPPAAVLGRAGLPMGLFDQDKILVSTEDLFALYRGIAEASDDPAIGLKLGMEPRRLADDGASFQQLMQTRGLGHSGLEVSAIGLGFVGTS